MGYVQSNKRIAVNTLLLYIRMSIMMVINLYITRALLKNFGAVNFGIYSLLNSIVVLMTFLNGSLTGASQRFIAYGIGEKDYKKANDFFSMSIVLFFIFALIIFILCQTLGLWVVKYKLVYPAELGKIIVVVFEIIVVTCLVNVLILPFNALIIASEKLNFFAILGCVEGVSKIVLVVLMSFTSSNKIIFYATGLLIISLLQFLLYYLYIKQTMTEFSVKITSINVCILKELSSFASWFILVSAAYILMSHGVNFLLNIFYGPNENASYAIAMQLKTAIMIFLTNLRLAIDPQIIKVYANNQHEQFEKLFYTTAKITFFLILLITFPIILNLESILTIWLSDVPSSTLLFCKLILIYVLIQSIDNSFGVYFKASGHIKENTLASGISYIAVCPTTYLLYKAGLPPESVFYVEIVAAICVGFIVKVLLFKKYAGFSIKKSLFQFFLPCTAVFVIGIILLVPLSLYVIKLSPLLQILSTASISCITILILAFALGFNKEDQQYIMFHLNKMRVFTQKFFCSSSD